MSKHIHQLSPDQQAAFDAIMAWLKTDEKTFALAGCAGTGKTTLAKSIANETDAVFCAYTGKAANVLREKGCSPATTIHGLIYKLAGEEDNEPVFNLNHNSDAKDFKLVIVDEYSMLSEEIIFDLKQLGKKILFLGDNFQLPPIMGECPIKPDFVLTQVHRQALDSPIIRAATDVRNGIRLQYCNEGDFIFQHRSKISRDQWLNADQIICGRNVTRQAINIAMRKEYGFSGHFPQAGEKIMCLKNNRRRGLFNGMIGLVTKGAKQTGFERLELSFETFKDLNVWDGDFLDNTGAPHGPAKYFERFGFAYGITCHKSQGSEFDKIFVVNQPIGKTSLDRQKWQYTAITRARKQVVLMDE